MRPAGGRRTRSAILVLTVALAACGRSAPPPPEPAGPTGPARRIVTLAPHLAEMVFAAGAGDHLVGVVEFSDFPPAARHLPRVGDAFRVDYEALAALKPDLVLAWTSGNPPEALARLRRLGFRVVALEPATLADIGRQIAEVGALAGTAAVAEAAAGRFSDRLAALERRAAGASTVSVFMQLSARPYFTVTDRHFLGQGLTLCAGRNVFGSLPGLTATVSVEAVLDAAPEAIIASDTGAAATPLAAWQRWPSLPAVRYGNLFLVDADLLSRPGARILDGIESLCNDLDAARLHRARAGSRKPAVSEAP